MRYVKPILETVAFDATDIVMTSVPEVLNKSGANLGELDSQLINLFS